MPDFLVGDYANGSMFSGTDESVITMVLGMFAD